VIFLTVGTQLPFDRLVATVDEWAGRTRREVFAQVGESSLSPANLEWAPTIDPTTFKEKMSEAEFVISHAGMGSILTALQYDKPILVMPRRAALREMRNDHQVATANWLAQQGRVSVAQDEAELSKMLDDLDSIRPTGRIEPWASPELLTTIRDFLAEE